MMQQTANAVLMIRPAAFGYNAQTAATNKMQRLPADEDGSAPQGIAPAQARALTEFDDFAGALQSEGVSVCVVVDTADPPKPDAVFPNNWVSFHEDGALVLYPMQAVNRRWERRQEVIDAVVDRLGFKVGRVVDLTKHEVDGRFLEGTGSLALDNTNRCAYACKSPRTHPDVVEEWAHELGYEVVLFDALDRAGVPYYHTNVMMCVGERMAVLATCAMPSPDRERVVAKLRGTGRDVIEIDYDEIDHFAGNMLELASWDEALGDCHLLVMSETARHAVRPETYARLAASTDSILTVPVPTIEKLGGGGVRCMLAEVFLSM